MLIYKTTNVITGKIYIGQDSKNNPGYFGSGVKIKNSITKYGIENFRKETLCECSTQEELDEMEIFWIAELNSQNILIGYNIHKGGTHFVECDGTTREKISRTLKGRKLPKETCEKMSLSRTGDGHWMKKNDFQGFSDETKKKMSDAKKGIKQSSETIEKRSKSMVERWKDEDFRKQRSDENLGEDNPFFGKTHTEDVRKRISESQKGKKWYIHPDTGHAIQVHSEDGEKLLLVGYIRGRVVNPKRKRTPT